MEVDITTLATMQGALRSIVDEMSHVMVRTARTPVFKLAKDFSCTVCDWECRQLVQGDAELPVQVGAISFVCRAVAKAYEGDIHPGDYFLCNDPAHGGLHVHDMALLQPIFIEDELVFWAVIRAHWLDIGGPASADLRRAQSDCYGEGLRVPPIKIYDRGQRLDNIIDFYFANLRFPDKQNSDMLSMMAACNIAAIRLVALIDKYGMMQARACVEELYDRMEQRVRRAIQALPDGSYTGNSWMAAREGDAHIEFTAEVTVQGDTLSVVLHSPPQLRDVRNSPFGATHAAVGHAVAIALGVAPPFNEGLYRPLNIDYGPYGSITNAQVPPAPTQGCTTQPFCEIVDCVRAAMSKVIPAERQTAGWSAAASTNLAGINPETDLYYAHFHPNGGSSGGAGAVYGLDGWSGTGAENSAGAVHKEPVELLEYEMPFRLHRLEYRTDSGGAGRWRGGVAVDCEWEPLNHGQTARFNGVIDTFPALGVDGAKSTLIEPKLGERRAIDPDGTIRSSRGDSRIHSESGGRLELRPPGGGGVGDPFLRDPELVRADVLDGLVSLKGAALDYGVVLDPESLIIDEQKTQELRNQ
jgi:N-methylhydantoinase B